MTAQIVPTAKRNRWWPTLRDELPLLWVPCRLLAGTVLASGMATERRPPLTTGPAATGPGAHTWPDPMAVLILHL